MSTVNTAPPASVRPHTAWGRAIGIAVGAAVVVALIVLAFVWPTVTSSVKNIPIAVAGTSQQVSAVTDALNTQAEGAFAVTAVADRSAAVDLINTRDVYGAIVLGDASASAGAATGPEILTASANGAAVSQVLNQLATPIQAQANAAAQAAVSAAVASGAAPAGTTAPAITVTVTDVVPLASTDARGLGLTAAAFPLVLGGILGGVLISLLITGVWRRLTSVLVYAVTAGIVVTVVMQPLFGILQGSFIVNALAVVLAMAATSSFVVGANALLGRAGIAVGSVITMLIGNPLSSAAQPLQFTVGPWGAVGQWFVPGSSATLIRDLSYFPDASSVFPWLVLAGWTLLGVVGMIAGHFRNQRVIRSLPVELDAPHDPAHARHAEPALAH
ncbi:ABC transporter permease [Subtercola endophyticus]|uniref:ABC transporter permease n=1 Tax=Subtercola endophyticus TaxID=2895559 RepID=UPI001E2A2D76|nr:ABC transporter permease [Subtercola endophyticus]UFS59199.1 ABC transporter permease [Subtercola endophyticus]